MSKEKPPVPAGEQPTGAGGKGMGKRGKPKPIFFLSQKTAISRTPQE